MQKAARRLPQRLRQFAENYQALVLEVLDEPG
jgi:hypothetical protein